MKSLLLSLVLLTGCSLGGNKSPAPAIYDFGLKSLPSSVQVVPHLNASILMTEITAPVWLATPAIQYRLAYHDAARSYHYAQSRWVTSPAKLLSRRIQDDLVQSTRKGVVSSHEGLKSDYALHLELEEFTQVFDQPHSSRAVIRLRANLVERATRQLIAQHKFSVEQATTSADAAGAVAALIQLSDQLSTEIIRWLADQLTELAGKSL